GQQQTPQAKMNTRQLRICRQHLTILLRRLIPPCLSFQRFCIEQAHLSRGRSAHDQLLRSPYRHVRIDVHCEVKHLRFIREVLVELPNELSRVVGLIELHAAAHAIQVHGSFEVFVANPCSLFLDVRDCLLTFAALCQRRPQKNPRLSQSWLELQGLTQGRDGPG